MRSASLLLLAGGSILALSAFGPAKPGTVLAMTKGYRKWAKANEQPYAVGPAVSALCRAAIPGPKPQDSGPHSARRITVYVNSVGKEAMMEGKPFPVGSVIVKEKWVYMEREPELSTVMIRRSDGWEYAALDGLGKKELPIDKASCTSCHAGQRKQDYVFRTYIPR